MTENDKIINSKGATALFLCVMLSRLKQSTVVEHSRLKERTTLPPDSSVSKESDQVMISLSTTSCGVTR